MIHKIDIQKYLPYFKDVKIEYKYTKDDDGQGVIVWLRYKDQELKRVHEYSNISFDKNIINLEQIRNNLIVKIFEDYIELINQNKVQKPKTFLQKLLNEILIKA